MVWLLNSEVKICLIVIIIVLMFWIFRKVFCCLVKEVFGIFLVVVEECMVNDVCGLLVSCW